MSGPDECWEWLAARTGKGYGKYPIRYRVINAHRVAYEMFHGLIPPGLLVCHRCDNKLCQNPSHLFVGTNQDNVDDYWRKNPAPPKVVRVLRDRTAVCVNGHPFTPTNSYRDTRGKLVCRPCKRAHERRREQRLRVQQHGI